MKTRHPFDLAYSELQGVDRLKCLEVLKLGTDDTDLVLEIYANLALDQISPCIF